MSGFDARTLSPSSRPGSREGLPQRPERAAWDLLACPDPVSFDIDVDLGPLLAAPGPLLVSAGWYELAQPRQSRQPTLQRKLDQMMANLLLERQWQAACRRVERRRAVRVPLLSRVHVDSGKHLVACDISLAGLRCSGRPANDDLDIEFRLPGLEFPVAARARVTHFHDANVIPLAGLRFTDIEPVYVEQIARYIAHRGAERRVA